AALDVLAVVSVDAVRGPHPLSALHDPQVDAAAAAGAGLRDSLLRHGGILFRGFAVDGAEGFSQAVQGFSPNMLDYLERA
ncbi:hypothetical protein NPS74_24350, partial [Cutibacterium acnes subsp. acnes]|nr:hypothetical protein [Cutibacterium acnes subsp. acnes]